jgi:1-phosphatidylinositol-3-phosphate 5-kinase
MFKSSFWTDNTGGKSKSDFYKSINEKYVLKVVSNNEIRMFNEFALSYFEYMCRSFTQKCPTAIGKILGAYKIKIRNPDKRINNIYHVILMENLTVGIDSNKPSLHKYDLKGSMLRRYVLTDGKSNVTKLDSNLLEDQNSRPISMEYTMNRLMKIAIHNDTSFLSRHEKIDYSLLVWIDHDTKLMRVGIIDYIQYYSLEKMLESKYKTLLSSGKAPTILNPNHYKIRFQKSMSNYFIGILSDNPCESFAVLVKNLLKKKQENTSVRAESNQEQMEFAGNLDLDL